MSEPEIARRCSACGLSVRQRAVFCPQCGNPIGEHQTTATETVVAAAPTEPLPPEPDGMLARVEKFRKVSSVVIDQAAYDPSLRFVLIAIALFLIFLILLLASKILG